MKIKINLILFILFSSATVKGQEKSDLAQGAYLKAEEIKTGKKLAASIFTVHNLAYQGVFPYRVLGER